MIEIGEKDCFSPCSLAGGGQRHVGLQSQVRRQEGRRRQFVGFGQHAHGHVPQLPAARRQRQVALGLEDGQASAASGLGRRLGHRDGPVRPRSLRRLGRRLGRGGNRRVDRLRRRVQDKKAKESLSS